MKEKKITTKIEAEILNILLKRKKKNENVMKIYSRVRFNC